MNRVKAIVGANFLLSIAAVFARIGYLLLRGSPMPTEYVGARVIPAWVDLLIYYSILLFLFFIRNETFYRRPNEVYLRGIAGLSGAFGLAFELVLPLLKADVYGEEFYTFERAIWWYICSSNVAYGLIGSVRPEIPPIDVSRMKTDRPGIEPTSSPSRMNKAARPTQEEELRRFSYADEFKKRQGPAFPWVHVVGIFLSLIIMNFIVRSTVSNAAIRGLSQVLVISGTLIILALSVWRDVLSARAVCPCRNKNILTCGALHCHICGERLDRGHCERCGVDESCLAVFRPLSESSGNNDRINYCPGCGAWLNSNFYRRGWRVL